MRTLYDVLPVSYLTNFSFLGLVPGTVYTIGVATNSKDKSSKRVVSTFATGGKMNINLGCFERRKKPKHEV